MVILVYIMVECTVGHQDGQKVRWIVKFMNLRRNIVRDASEVVVSCWVRAKHLQGCCEMFDCVWMDLGAVVVHRSIRHLRAGTATAMEKRREGKGR